MRSIRFAAQRGFTLIEILIVIIVMAVLVAVVLPRVVNIASRGRTAARDTDVKLLNDAVQRVQAEAGTCPADASQARSWLTATTRPSDWPANGNWNGPYIDTLPVNPVTGANYAFDAARCRFNN